MFMKPQVWQTWMLYVDTDCGSWILPDDFGDPSQHWNNDNEDYDSDYEKRILECCEDGKKVYSIERKFGWYASGVNGVKFIAKGLYTVFVFGDSAGSSVAQVQVRQER